MAVNKTRRTMRLFLLRVPAAKHRRAVKMLNARPGSAAHRWTKGLGSSVLQAGQFLAVVSTATGIVYAILAFERERGDREEERISRAWNLVSDSKARGQGNLGLNEALQALNRRNIDLWRIQLNGTYLSKVNLPRAFLDHADLEGARLEQANLCGAQLSQAKLKDANLRAADLRGAKLEGANLIGANLRGVNFSPLASDIGEVSGPVPTNLRGANLEKTDLSGANLAGADLRAARLNGAILFRADLRGAHLDFADLREAKLDAADLAKANLGAAILSGATLRGARLTEAILTAAQFDDVDTVRADFSRAIDVPTDIARTTACTDQSSMTQSLCGPPQSTVSGPDPRPQYRNVEHRDVPCVR